MGELESYRASKAEAIEQSDVATFDLLASTMIKVEPPLRNPLRTKEVRYRVHLTGGDPATAFIVGPTQAVKSIDANTAEVTVYAIRPGQPGGNSAAPADPPTDDDLRPNVFVQSDDPLIVSDARKAAGSEKDPWRLAVALERFVNRAIDKKDFTQAFASAAEVAKSHEGDCTEHSVYLMALCRARGIPARAAVGLVYLEPMQAFFYHMWTEVYIDNRWIPIDGTLALSGIGADHLKVAQSNLKDATALSAFLPVAQLMGRLSIKVVDAK
jgi:transglutaminase-like putative cysteine protease